MNRLSGKVALITGGTSGIGGASAELFAKEGAQVIIVGRDIQRGKDKEKEIIAQGGKVCYFRCDISKAEEIELLYKFLIKKYGRLDILFNNAGMLRTASLDEITDEDWDAMYDTNVKALMHICKRFIGMLQLSKGVILNNASINGLHSYIKGKRSYMYATTKSAVIQFTRYLAKNYAPNVRVNALCPGITVTNLFTNRDFSRFADSNLLGRMADPMEIANVALFLVSDESSFVTGEIMIADGGENIK